MFKGNKEKGGVMAGIPTYQQLLCTKLDKADREIERLKKLIKETYSEGWHDCYEHQKQYSIIDDWNKSEVKVKVEQALKDK